MKHALKSLYEVVIFDQTRRGLVQFRDCQCCGFFHIRVVVSQTVFEWFAKMLGNLLYSDTAHRAHSESSHQRIRLFTTVFLKRIDRHNRKIRFWFGVVDYIQIYQLFKFNRLRFHAFDHVREQRRNVFANRHHSDYLLGCFFAVFGLVGV